MTKVTWLDRVRDAFRTRNVDEFEKALKEKPDGEGDKPTGDDTSQGGSAAGSGKETPGKTPKPAGDDASAPGGGAAAAGGGGAAGGDAGGGSGGGTHHHITVNVGTAGGGAGGGGDAGAVAGDAAAAGADAANAGGAANNDDPAVTAAGAAQSADPLAVIVDAITKLAKRVDQIAALVQGGQAGNGGGTDQTGTSSDASGQSDNDNFNDKSRTTDAATLDAAGVNALRDEHQDVLSRGEILVSGIRFQTMTFDAKMDVAKTRDAICLNRRRALNGALLTERGREAMKGLFDETKQKIEDMKCEEVKILFAATSDKLRTMNNDGATRRSTVEESGNAIRSLKDINERNRAYNVGKKNL